MYDMHVPQKEVELENFWYTKFVHLEKKVTKSRVADVYYMYRGPIAVSGDFKEVKIGIFPK